MTRPPTWGTQQTGDRGDTAKRIVPVVIIGECGGAGGHELAVASGFGVADVEHAELDRPEIHRPGTMHSGRMPRRIHQMFSVWTALFA